MLRVWFGGVRSGLPALAVAAASVGLAVLWLQASKLAAGGVVVAGVAIGGVALQMGQRALSGTRPRPLRSVSWLTWSALIPASAGAAVACAIILVGIEVPKDTWSAQTKGLVAAATGAATTYMVAAFVKGAEDADAGWVGAAVRRAFQKTFTGRFAEGTEARDAVSSEFRFRGWGREARRERAHAIEQELGR